MGNPAKKLVRQGNASTPLQLSLLPGETGDSPGQQQPAPEAEKKLDGNRPLTISPGVINAVFGVRPRLFNGRSFPKVPEELQSPDRRVPSIILPVPQQSMADITEAFGGKIARSERYLMYCTWYTETSEPRWIRLKVAQCVASPEGLTGYDHHKKDLALKEPKFRLPTAKEALIAFLYLGKIRHPLLERELATYVSEKSLEGNLVRITIRNGRKINFHEVPPSKVGSHEQVLRITKTKSQN